MFLIFLYCIAIRAIIIWCLLQEPRKLVRCFVISPWWLRKYEQRLTNLIVLDWRGVESNVTVEALVVPVA